MTKDRARANDSAMSRRTLLAALPVSGAALTISPPAVASEPDPLVPLYHEWLEAHREWSRLADLPENRNWDDPRSLAAEAREYAAAEQMLALQPTSLEGIGALAALAFFHANLEYSGPQDELQWPELRALKAIWCACTGQTGNPTEALMA